MIVSYKWLQTYFKDALPAPSKVADAFTFGAFEVEGVEEMVGDTAIDLKVLPDRACYALSHRGVAYELSAITGQKSSASFDGAVANEHKVAVDNQEKVSVTVEDKILCRRYATRYIKNVSVGASPEWLRSMLESVGQRSINTIVDATNFVMLDMGQPLHAFDADNVQGGIVVRLAKAGEVIELLPEKGVVGTSRNIALQETDLVIADDAGPIAIAGVKGGLRAAVTDTTKNLIIESANFDPTSVRKTSTRLNLRNDASKRFENNLPVDLAGWAIEEVSALINKLSDGVSVGVVTDVFSQSAKKVVINVSTNFISAKLGIKIPTEKIEEILSSLQISCEKNGDEYVLTIPSARLDLNIPEDIVEEVGRIYGYDKVAPAIPQKIATNAPVDQFAYWTEKIKDVLFGLGFSEVQTSSFALKGDVEIQNPLASDKKFLRTFLYENILKSLEQNAKNAALLGTEEIKIFEIGTVFGADGEHFNIAIGVNVLKNTKKKDQIIAELINNAFNAISEVIGSKIQITKPLGQANPIVEMQLSDIISKLSTSVNWDIKNFSGETKYKPFSAYPFMVRDVAVFVPKNVSEKEVCDVIDSVAGPLKFRCDLFDVFTKKFENGEDKTSYAFRIVFQSFERTLKEEEINTVMKNISDALTAKSWQVR